METIIKYIKLPLHFDAAPMLAEVHNLSNVWLPHYNTSDYTGDWKAIPLRSVGGLSTQAVAAFNANNSFLDTELMGQCPVVKSVVDSLQCDKMAVRILNLRPNAVVKEHIDPGLCYEENEIRIHIPLSTNDEVEFYIDDEAVHPLPGECWYMNFNLKHRLANYGSTERIHLVIDCVVNDWVHQLFASCKEENVKRIPAPEAFNIDDRRRIIEQLKGMGTETALSMAKTMEEELANQ